MERDRVVAPDVWQSDKAHVLREISFGARVAEEEAVGAAVAYVLVPEGIVAMVWSQGSRWFPVRTFNFLPGSVFPADVGPAPPQGYAAALLVALLWMTAFILVSFAAFRRQDVSA